MVTTGFGGPQRTKNPKVSVTLGLWSGSNSFRDGILRCKQRVESPRVPGKFSEADYGHTLLLVATKSDITGTT